MYKTLQHFLSLIRFSHTIFALPFALLSAAMAWSVSQNFSIRSLLGILLCMVTARSAAMAFNRLVDRKIDAANPRTEGRHIPAGILSAGQVTLFTIFSSVAFVASTLLFLPNKLPLYLSIPVLLWLCGYSYAKRFTSLAHYWLGAALGMSPIAAWIAIRGDAVMENPMDLLPAVVLAGAVMAWVGGFDILYACQDYEYDRGAKLHSVPTWLGVRGALRLAAVSHVLTILLLAFLPLVYPPFGMVYWVGVALIAGLLIYEHSLVKPTNLDRVNLAFFHVNAIISIGLLLIGLADLIV